ncbi:NAD(P)-dependent oxidoreductase [Phyllobacterium sp. SB3]|uniref:NAD(P)-dependent oxidoreductase n=1 Tax=Phyllobacterium sp. SB3 TaxID=3156073 RepID=UPI0032AF790B
MRIVFCGNAFSDMPEYLVQALGGDHEVLVWDGNLERMPTNIDVLIPRAIRIGAAEMERGCVRFIQQFGVGLDVVDIAAAQARGIPVANVPGTGANADSVAEHALLLLLMLLRQTNSAQRSIRSGILGAPTGRTLAGQTVCLYGLGAVAQSIAKRIKAFDVRLVGLTRNPGPIRSRQFLLDQCYSRERAQACLSQSDILMMCVRHTPETTGLVGEKELRWLRPGALVINIARGGLIHREGLEKCLGDRHLGGVGLDVYWSEPVDPQDPLLRLPNVVATPHIAGITDASLTEIAEVVAANIVQFEIGGRLQHIVA